MKATHTHAFYSKGNEKNANQKQQLHQDCECRMWLPDRKRQRTSINIVDADTIWYLWHGGTTKKSLIEILPKRAEFDQFQNVSIPAISQSKLTCNSNVSMLSVGPIVFYVTK